MADSGQFLSSALSGFSAAQDDSKDRDRHRSSRSSKHDDDDRGHRSSRHRSRSRDRTRSHRDDRDSHRDRDDDRRRRRDDDRERDRDRDREHRSSRRSEDDRRERKDRDTNGSSHDVAPPPPPSSSRYDDRERDRDRDYRDRDRDRVRSRDDRDYRRDDRRGPPPRERSRDRRDRDYDRYGPPSRDRRDGRRDDRPEPTGNHGAGTIFGSPRRRSPTPDGTIPISKRKRPRTGWDVKPAGMENVTALQAKLTGRFNLPGQNRPNLPPGAHGGDSQHPNAYMPPIHFGTFQDNFPTGITYARQARRLYIGNVSDDATDESLGAFFNNEMRNRNLTLDEKVDVQSEHPVIKVDINKVKNYAFIEFRSPEEAVSAMALEGATFMGQQLKIRRPKDYLGDNMLGTGPGSFSGNVADTPNKLFIGGLPSYLTEDQIVELMKAFGDLKAFNLVKEANGQSKGFAFAEYVDPEVTDVACQGLSGMELGDRFLVVQRASVGQSGRSNASGSHAPTQDVTTLALRSAPNVIAGAASEGQPTRVLQMLNMVTPDELVDNQDYEDLLEDIKEECGKFGEILELKIPRPVMTEHGRMDVAASEKVPNLGKIFVMFDSTDATKRALRSIAGRQFGGRTVLCAYADEVVLLS